MDHLLFEQDHTVTILSEDQLVKKNKAAYVSSSYLCAPRVPFDLLHRTKVFTAATCG